MARVNKKGKKVAKKVLKKVSKKVAGELQVKKTTRKNIRKIIGIEDLGILTKAATEREEERRKRVKENQKVVSNF